MAQPAAMSWGRYPRLAQERRTLAWRGDARAALAAPGPLLAHGAGRSYGDSCQNEGGTLLATAAMDRFIAFDAARGEATVEAGLTLRDLARTVLPHGWFLPVVPGTQLVTVGGAIANDVHGKNHHVAGTFGRHVRALELARSDGTVRRCVPGDELFAATVGGLGLTGLILSATLALRRVRSSRIACESIPFDDLAGYEALCDASAGWEHSVAWLDCASRRAGRGLFLRGRSVEADDGSLTAPWGEVRRAIPVDLPAWTLGAPMVRAFNAMYWRAARARLREVPGDRFFFPLDAIAHWNRLYGRGGFVQFQCVLPPAAARAALAEMLQAIAAAGQGSFLSVLKRFGTLESPGLLSFPRPGHTFALDFPMRGAPTRALLARLEAIALAAGGALYPAKDACMSPQAFRASFPALERFRASVDPAFSSSFWRRVQGAG